MIDQFQEENCLKEGIFGGHIGSICDEEWSFESFLNDLHKKYWAFRETPKKSQKSPKVSENSRKYQRIPEIFQDFRNFSRFPKFLKIFEISKDCRNLLRFSKFPTIFEIVQDFRKITWFYKFIENSRVFIDSKIQKNPKLSGAFRKSGYYSKWPILIEKNWIPNENSITIFLKWLSFVWKISQRNAVELVYNSKTQNDTHIRHNTHIVRTYWYYWYALRSLYLWWALISEYII